MASGLLRGGPGRTEGAAVMLARFIRDEEGLVSVEYAILLAVLVVGAIMLWRHFGRHVRRMPRRAARFWPAG